MKHVYTFALLALMAAAPIHANDVEDTRIPCRTVQEILYTDPGRQTLADGTFYSPKLAAFCHLGVDVNQPEALLLPDGSVAVRTPAQETATTEAPQTPGNDTVFFVDDNGSVFTEDGCCVKSALPTVQEPVQAQPTSWFARTTASLQKSAADWFAYYGERLPPITQTITANPKTTAGIATAVAVVTGFYFFKKWKNSRSTTDK